MEDSISYRLTPADSATFSGHAYMALLAHSDDKVPTHIAGTPPVLSPQYCGRLVTSSYGR